MNDYKPGDKVRVRGDVNIHDGEVLAAYENHVWVKYPDGDHELVVAGDVMPWAEPLPSEPHSAWIDKYGKDVWWVDGLGDLRCAASPSSDPAKYAPFTRLVPLGLERTQIIREVIEWQALTFWPNEFSNVLTETREHFGVMY